MRNYINKVVRDNGSHYEYEYSNQTDLDIQYKIDEDIRLGDIAESYYYDEDGQLRFYWTKATGRQKVVLKGEKEMKLNKVTEEELRNDMFEETSSMQRSDVNEAIKYLKENNLIEFKKEIKHFKAFVKIVTINGENKRLYYKTDFHLTENIEEAKLFDESEKKDGYAFELVAKEV